MQDIMSANTPAQQSVIQNNSSSMNVDQRQDDQVSNNNQLLFTATIFAAPANDQQSMSNNSNAQALMNDLNPFLTGSINITQQGPNNEQLMSPSSENEDKDSYKGKFSRMSQWKAQLPKREPHNYDKCQPTPHQTTIYNQILAQQQETPTVTAAPLYNNSPYMTDVATANINHMPSNQTNSGYSNANCSGQNAMNLSSSQMYTNKMMNFQVQVIFINLNHRILLILNYLIATAATKLTNGYGSTTAAATTT